MKFPLLGGSGEERFDDVSGALTQNWYVNKSRKGKSQVSLYPTPGLTLFSDVGDGPHRGSIKYNDAAFMVSGNELYELNAGGGWVLRGTLNTSQGRVGMAHNGADNGQQLIIVDGTNGYIWDSGASTFTVIADADYPDTATHVLFFDGFFVVNDPSVTGQFFKSGSYDGTAWDALDFATAERDPDKLLGMLISNRSLWLIGEDTAEKWFNSGAADFPYEPDQSGLSEWGTIAPYSLIDVTGMAFWLSNNEEGQGLVVMTTGGTPQVISTPEIAAEISKMSVISDCYTWSYQYQQHAFVVFTFPTAQKTLFYDILTQEWGTWVSKDLGYHRSASHAFAFSKHLVGDPQNGKVYELDWDNFTDNGDQIIRKRISQKIHAEDKALKHEGVWLDMKEGVGNSNVEDPKVNLRFRDNNGKWSNYKTRSVGKIGERRKKIAVRKLGRSFDREYEIMVSEPYEAVIVDAFARLDADEREIG